jgi:hypothetical protein
MLRLGQLGRNALQGWLWQRLPWQAKDGQAKLSGLENRAVAQAGCELQRAQSPQFDFFGSAADVREHLRQKGSHHLRL